MEQLVWTAPSSICCGYRLLCGSRFSAGCPFPLSETHLQVSTQTKLCNAAGVHRRPPCAKISLLQFLPPFLEYLWWFSLNSLYNKSFCPSWCSCDGISKKVKIHTFLCYLVCSSDWEAMFLWKAWNFGFVLNTFQCNGDPWLNCLVYDDLKNRYQNLLSIVLLRHLYISRPEVSWGARGRLSWIGSMCWSTQQIRVLWTVCWHMPQWDCLFPGGK